MPEFQMPLGDNPKTFKQFDSFTQGYIEAIFFTECHSDNPEMEDCSLDDASPEMLARIVEDCKDFQEGCSRDSLGRSLLDLAYDYAAVDYDDHRAGVDFWLTRNRHGAGFWDRGLGLVGKNLTDMAHAYSEANLYKGDDGKLYLA